MLARSAGHYACALVAVLAVLAAFFALSYAATFVNRDVVVGKLEGANARGALRATSLTIGSRVYPRFGANDCVFFPAVLQDYPSRIAQALSVRLDPNETVAPKLAPDEPTVPACLQVIAALERRCSAASRLRSTCSCCSRC
jgi:hypothetical protein